MNIYDCAILFVRLPMHIDHWTLQGPIHCSSRGRLLIALLQFWKKEIISAAYIWRHQHKYHFRQVTHFIFTSIQAESLFGLLFRPIQNFETPYFHNHLVQPSCIMDPVTKSMRWFRQCRLANSHFFIAYGEWTHFLSDASKERAAMSRRQTVSAGLVLFPMSCLVLSCQSCF